MQIMENMQIVEVHEDAFGTMFYFMYLYIHYTATKHLLSFILLGNGIESRERREAFLGSKIYVIIIIDPGEIAIVLWRMRQ